VTVSVIHRSLDADPASGLDLDEVAQWLAPAVRAVFTVAPRSLV
jgi:hypothetical protein